MQKIKNPIFGTEKTICTSGENSPLVRVLEKEKYEGKTVVSIVSGVKKRGKV